MNLLVTNTSNVQAYAIIRGLRPYARKVVVTVYGPNRFVARLSHAANSRYVGKRYWIPSSIEDWRKGRLQRENTEREEEYIRAVLRMCEQEGIDVIFPSWDPLVYGTRHPAACPQAPRVLRCKPRDLQYLPPLHAKC